MERRFPCYGSIMQNGHSEYAQNKAFFWWKEVIEETFEGLKKDDIVGEVKFAFGLNEFPQFYIPIPKLKNKNML